MQKIVLITGSTDAIGLATAEMLISQGHRVLLHGRNPAKLEAAEKLPGEMFPDWQVEGYLADLAHME